MSDLKLPELPQTPLSFPTYGNVYTAAQMLAIRDSGIRYGMERAAVIAASNATCPCNGDRGRCLENDVPLSIAAAIRAALQE
jgi:hypothetical protein